jgi:hypothetical protein
MYDIIKSVPPETKLVKLDKLSIMVDEMYIHDIIQCVGFNSIFDSRQLNVDFANIARLINNDQDLRRFIGSQVGHDQANKKTFVITKINNKLRNIYDIKIEANGNNVMIQVIKELYYYRIINGRAIFMSNIQ